jgi:hypothetical protein
MQWLAVIAELTNEALLDGRDPGAAFDAVMSTADLDAPVPDPLFDQQPRVSERARELLRSGTAPEWSGDPLPEVAMMAQWMVIDSLVADIEEQDASGERLYALEFQGPSRQYIMFGRSTNLKCRIDEHTRAANPHGWALLNGWVSLPLLPNAKRAESVLLRMGGRIHIHRHYRERFYEMPYGRSLNLVRCIVDHFSSPEIRALLQAESGRPAVERRSRR